MKKLTRIAITTAFATSMLSGCSPGSTSTDEAASSGEGLHAAGTASAETAVESEAVETTVAENAVTHEATLDYSESDVVDILLGVTISSDSSVVSIDGSTVTIVAGGTYRLSGTLTDGQVVVDAGEATVQLILAGVDITNDDGAAIGVMSAGSAVIVLEDGTMNTVTDGSVYVLAEGEDEPNAALYATSDLTITGDGSLIVYGNYNDAIASKDGLVIESGNITVIALDDGIRGKDYVVINDGTIDVTAGGDGIKSDNEEDPSMGYILISDGSITVTSRGDAIQATTDVLVTAGDFTISAGGVSSASVAADHSGKGIKGAVSVVIEGGSFDIDSADDAIHSNEAVTINAGEFEIATGDDGIHADDTVEINGGTIDIAESYEGMEGSYLTINDGDITIVASDDGLNVAGGVDGSGTMTSTRETNQDAFRSRDAAGGGQEVSGDYHVYINGGTIVIYAYGDGIDSNGNVTMTDGLVIIHGSTSSRDSALDHNGTFEMNGGFVIGVNIDGMMSEGINGGTQASMYLTSSSALAAGTVLHIETAEGESLLTFESAYNYSAIVFSSPDLVAGEAYNIYLEGTASGNDFYGLYEADAYSPGTLAGTATAG